MKKLFGCFLCMMLLVFGVVPSAWTDSFTLQGVNYPSQIRASVDFDYTSISETAGTIDIDITNTSSITSSLTAFAFNVPDVVTGASLTGTVPTGWSALFNKDGINTPGQYGFFDLAGITKTDFNGGKVAYGIPAPPDTTFSFTFSLIGTNLNLLDENSFLSLLSAPPEHGQPDPQYFIARFQGIGGESEGGSDVAIPNPVPEPTTMLLLGSGLVGLAGFGRKKFKK